MKRFIISSLFILSLSTLLQAQKLEDYMGKWDLKTGVSPFDQISIQTTNISEGEVILLFYQEGKLWNRGLGKRDIAKKSLVCRFKDKEDAYSMQLSLSDKKDQLQLMANIRKGKTKERQSLSLVLEKHRLMLKAKPLENPEKAEIKEVEIVDIPKPQLKKTSFAIHLKSCQPCQQYTIHLKNDSYHKTAIPNNKGLAKFSQVPVGKYQVSVGWKAKVDRPDSPPYKKINIVLMQGHKKNYYVPLK